MLYAAHLTIGVRLFRQPRLTPDQWRRAVGFHLLCAPDCRSTLASLRRSSQRFKLIHLSMLLPSIPIILSLSIAGHHIAATAFGAITWFINAWPIVLQRYNRARIESVLRSLDRVHARCATA